MKASHLAIFEKQRLINWFQRTRSAWRFWQADSAALDRLSQRFGDENIFMDIDTIEPGLDFIRFPRDLLGKIPDHHMLRLFEAS